ASLDPPGEVALAEALRQLKMAERTVVIVTHRPAALSQCDLILALIDGAPQAFGPREDMMKRLSGGTPQPGGHPGAPPMGHPAPQAGPQVVRTRPPLASVPGGAAAAGAMPPNASPAHLPPAMEDGHAPS
ncbi:type I secretion system permease/ATPase, partial [Xanthobacter autotrophicus ATCC 700551]